MNRWLSKKEVLGDIHGVFFPEIIDNRRIDSVSKDPLLRSLPKAALFHDAIAVKFPDWCPVKTVQHFPGYLECLAQMDQVICISSASEDDLLQYWEKAGIQAARTSVVPLGLPNIPQSVSNREPRQANSPLRVLSVGTFEARKNHLALLQACESLWVEGIDFELVLVGMLNRETGTPAANEVKRLRSKGRPVTWEGALSDGGLHARYSEADIFAYPSLYEGFGIPVLEAASYGLPVLTTFHGALAEVSRGGGCVTCDGTPAGIAESLRDLITDDSLRDKLSAESKTRSVRTMKNVFEDIRNSLLATGDHSSS
jgi:glycosyltransferase involved in cell wall biosynthesis